MKPLEITNKFMFMNKMFRILVRNNLLPDRSAGVCTSGASIRQLHATSGLACTPSIGHDNILLKFIIFMFSILFDYIDL